MQRKIGIARTPGERDGLTKPQAEKRLRELRASVSPPLNERASIADAGQVSHPGFDGGFDARFCLAEEEVSVHAKSEEVPRGVARARDEARL
jgi:hypothetical protein